MIARLDPILSSDSEMTHSKGEGGKKNFAVYPACDFIAAITPRLRSGTAQHIPEKRCQMVRYSEYPSRGY